MLRMRTEKFEQLAKQVGLAGARAQILQHPQPALADTLLGAFAHRCQDAADGQDKNRRREQRPGNYGSLRMPLASASAIKRRASSGSSSRAVTRLSAAFRTAET